MSRLRGEYPGGVSDAEWEFLLTAANAYGHAQAADLAAQLQVVAGGTVEGAFVDPGYTGDSPAAQVRAEGIRFEAIEAPRSEEGLRPAAATVAGKPDLRLRTMRVGSAYLSAAELVCFLLRIAPLSNCTTTHTVVSHVPSCHHAFALNVFCSPPVAVTHSSIKDSDLAF